MGPLVSRAATIGRAARALAGEAGGERVLLVEPPSCPPPYVGPGLVRFADDAQTHPYQRDEIFGPEAALYPVSDLDEASPPSTTPTTASPPPSSRATARSYEHCVGRIRDRQPQLEQGHRRRQRQAPLRRLGPQRQRPPRRHHRDGLLHLPPGPPRERGRLRPRAPAAGNAAAVSDAAANRATARTVLMGDPSHFSVKGGANPHTRTRWGTKRHVDRALAIEQWHAPARHPRRPGRARPRRAAGPGAARPRLPRQRRLHAGRRRRARSASAASPREPAAHPRRREAALPARARSKPASHRDIDERYRFEGEADFFPAGDVYLLTHGKLERQRFVPTSHPAVEAHLRLPHRRPRRGPLLAADRRAERNHQARAPARGPLPRRHRALRIRPAARFLLAYRDGIAARSGLGAPARALRRAPDRALRKRTPRCYAANSFTLTAGRRVLPGDARRRLGAAARRGPRARRHARSPSTSPSS